MSAKLHNTHKYPAANHQPRHKAAERKLQAEARQFVYDELSLQHKDRSTPSRALCKETACSFVG